MKLVAITSRCKDLRLQLVKRPNLSHYAKSGLQRGECGAQSGIHKSVLFSNIQMWSLYGKWVSSNSYLCTVKNSLLRLITLHPAIFQTPFQPQPKNKHFPSIILRPNYIPPTALFHWLMLLGLFMLWHSKENSPTERCGRAQLTWYNASSLLQLHTMFTTAFLIKNTLEKEKNNSIFMHIPGLKWQNAPLSRFAFSLPQLFLCTIVSSIKRPETHLQRFVTATATQCWSKADFPKKTHPDNKLETKKIVGDKGNLRTNWCWRKEVEIMTKRGAFI